jgi:hypothetical protein
MADMKGRSIYLVVLGIVAVVAGCRKLYSPPIVANANNYLVVEGVINPGNDSTFITLSHTVNIADAVGTAKETGATVTVEGGGANYPLTEIRAGVYAAMPLNLDIKQKYHLHIKLKNGKDYLSDDAEAKLTPPIDTITYDIKNDMLQINASAHDPLNNTRYYRWDYDEAWRFHAKYYSGFKVQGGFVVPRLPSEDVFSCFASGSSSSIAIASSVKLAQDVIARAPVTTIASSSEKISVRYSVLVRQYALTKEGYSFYENLQKNTEKLGSIFDALPSEIRGNIHNTVNPAEPVLGYVGISTVQKKRVFIDKEELPDAWQTKYPYDCTSDSSLYFNPKTKIDEVKAFILPGYTMPTGGIYGTGTDPIGYFRTAFICGDCTLRGTKKQPAFWRDK